MIISYLGETSFRRRFFLLDTFEGFHLPSLSPEERAMVAKRYRYQPCLDEVTRTFAAFPSVEIIPGTVPDTLSKVKTERVAFLSLDMNCVAPEIAAARHLRDKLVPGGIMVLDDYGFTAHSAQKQAFDRFAVERNASILSLPTGQRLIFQGGGPGGRVPAGQPARLPGRTGPLSPPSPAGQASFAKASKAKNASPPKLQRRWAGPPYLSLRDFHSPTRRRSHALRPSMRSTDPYRSIGRVFYGWWIVAVAMVGECLCHGSLVVYTFGSFLKPLARGVRNQSRANRPRPFLCEPGRRLFRAGDRPDGRLARHPARDPRLRFGIGRLLDLARSHQSARLAPLLHIQFDRNHGAIRN